METDKNLDDKNKNSNININTPINLDIIDKDNDKDINIKGTSLGNKSIIMQILSDFENNNDLGFIFPEHFLTTLRKNPLQ